MPYTKDRWWWIIPRAPGNRLPAGCAPPLLGTLALLLVALLAVAIAILVNDFVIQPGEYAQLAKNGVAVSANYHCSYLRGRHCDLTYNYGGQRTFAYPQNDVQFKGDTGTVEVMVDPANPSVAYTTFDIQDRYIDLGLFLLAILVLALVGAFMTGMTIWVKRSF